MRERYIAQPHLRGHHISSVGLVHLRGGARTSGATPLASFCEGSLKLGGLASLNPPLSSNWPIIRVLARRPSTSQILCRLGVASLPASGPTLLRGRLHGRTYNQKQNNPCHMLCHHGGQGEECRSKRMNESINQ